MSGPGCAREPELLAVLRAGRPAESWDDELRAHLERCEPCRDLLDVASAVLQDRETVQREASLPGSGLVWWRMQMRARQETARTARRTLLLAQVLSVSVAAGIALAAVPLLAPDWASRLASAVPSAARGFAPMLLALLAWLALAGAPLAAYLATRED